MEINFLALLVAALSSFLIGFIWYNPKTFGNIWMREAGINPEDAKKANLFRTFGFSLLFAFMLAFALMPFVIHQIGALGMVGGDATLAKPSYQAFIDDYGTNYRTFKHGAFHGLIAGIFVALPILGMNALFEGKSWKYILINAGYWIVSLIVMGAIISGWQ